MMSSCISFWKNLQGVRPQSRFCPPPPLGGASSSMQRIPGSCRATAQGPMLADGACMCHGCAPIRAPRPFLKHRTAVLILLLTCPFSHFFFVCKYHSNTSLVVIFSILYRRHWLWRTAMAWTTPWVEKVIGWCRPATSSAVLHRRAGILRLEPHTAFTGEQGFSDAWTSRDHHHHR
jgi:hypothetical protein